MGMRAVWLLAWAGLLGCDTGFGGAATGAECASDPAALTWEDFGQTFMAEYCVRCHGSYGSLTAVRNDALRIDHAAGAGPDHVNTIMPQSSPRPSLEERQALAEWLACGAP